MSHGTYEGVMSHLKESSHIQRSHITTQVEGFPHIKLFVNGV